MNWSPKDMDQRTGIREDGSLTTPAMAAFINDARQYPELYELLNASVDISQKGAKYVYHTRTMTYYVAATGQPLTDAQIEAIIENRITEGVDKLDRMRLAAEDSGNNLSIKDYQEAMAAELRNGHLQAYIIGMGGLNRVFST